MWKRLNAIQANVTEQNQMKGPARKCAAERFNKHFFVDKRFAGNQPRKIKRLRTVG